MVRDAVDELPQASVDVHVLVCERLQPDATTAAVEGVAVTGPQLSVAVAVPSAESIAPAVGLQPRLAPLATEPEAVITGAEVSSVYVYTCVQVAVLPHASVAVYVLVRVREQPLETVLSLGVTVGVLQLSVAVAPPAGGMVGLQPSAPPAGQAVNTGGVLSLNEINCVHEAELPHTSETVCVRVIDPLQVVPTSGPDVHV